MKLQQYIVDAFASQPFTGNPAAICPLEDWLDDQTLQAIAAQNNLSETAYFVPTGPNRYHLRWFTPANEVPLCGHATVAAGFVIKNFVDPSAENIQFDSLGGPLSVACSENGYTLDFPCQMPEPCAPPEGLIEAIGANPIACLSSAYYLLVYPSQEIVENIEPDFRSLKGIPKCQVIVTAEGRNYDFVSRFFAPGDGIDEDPVTGSAHCILTPYWSRRLKKQKLTAKQISPRGGELVCQLAGERVMITGQARLFLKGQIWV